MKKIMFTMIGLLALGLFSACGSDNELTIHDVPTVSNESKSNGLIPMA